MTDRGMLLLSYPSIESFTVSNFEEQSFNKAFAIGQDLKQYAHQMNYNHQRNLTCQVHPCQVQPLKTAMISFLKEFESLRLPMDLPFGRSFRFA